MTSLLLDLFRIGTLQTKFPNSSLWQSVCQVANISHDLQFVSLMKMTSHLRLQGDKRQFVVETTHVYHAKSYKYKMLLQGKEIYFIERYSFSIISQGSLFEIPSEDNGITRWPLKNVAVMAVKYNFLTCITDRILADFQQISLTWMPQNPTDDRSTLV